MKKLLQNFHQNVYPKFFKNYFYELEKAVKDSKSLIDIGCGTDSPIKYFSKKIHAVGIDAFLPSIEKSKKQNIHDEYYQIGVLDIDKHFEDKSFDCALASDLIEHLTKEDGLKLIELMEKVASKRVIIFTPNGFLQQGEYDNNPWQVHLSGWSVEEMQERGYKVIGINGWKPLRGEYSNIKYSPKSFWMFISDITQFFVRNNPKKAFQIMCIKEFNN